MDCIIGVDVGGTDIKYGKFYGNVLIETRKTKTNKTDFGMHILTEVYSEIDDLTGTDNLVAIGMGVPGPVVDGFVLGAQNLGWKGLPVKELIRAHYPGVKVTVLNDANAATIGEMMFGGGHGYKDFVFITLGTGIGGGIIINKQLIEGTTGSGGEIGHLRVGFNNDRLCTCGLYDCVEQYASATGVVKSANNYRIGRNTVLNEIEELTSKIVFNAAEAGDVVANEIVEEMVEKLATALSQVANTLNPEAFVIGGGVSKAGDFLLNKLSKRFKELAFFSVRDVKFELAKLGNEAGIYGNMYNVSKELNDEN
jgi:glucokinase